MTEQSTPFRRFDTEQVSTFLAADVQAARDLTHGQGNALHIPDSETVLEVFPQGVVRVTTDHARLEVHKVATYSIDADRGHVVFEQGKEEHRTRLVVRDNGKVSFYPLLGLVEAPRRRPRPTNNGKSAETAKEPSADATAPTAPRATSNPEGQEPEPITLHGRLGRDPWFSTRDDRKAAGFPLAINPENGGKAIWHDVVTFAETADQLRQDFDRRDITKGKLVAVTGHPVVVEQETPRGTKKVREIHASEVARVRATVVSSKNQQQR